VTRYADRVKAVIVGCGRVGSAVAKKLAADGWDVTCVDEDETSLARLGAWSGGFVAGHGMDASVLERAGIATADAAVVATDGDNTNIVLGQVLQKRWEVPCVVVRILDPARASFYELRGLRTVCPTKTAIASITDAVKAVGEPAGAESA
jgi:trk system potassium uptake protein